MLRSSFFARLLRRPQLMLHVRQRPLLLLLQGVTLSGGMLQLLRQLGVFCAQLLHRCVVRSNSLWRGTGTHESRPQLR